MQTKEHNMIDTGLRKTGSQDTDLKDNTDKAILNKINSKIFSEHFSEVECKEATITIIIFNSNLNII